MNSTTQSDLEPFAGEDGELRRLLLQLPDNARQATDLPEAFWNRQRTAIGAAIATQPARLPVAALAWGAALALLITALLLTDVGRGNRPQPRHDRAADAISDQQLLMKVQYTVENDVPVALEPAALLAREMEGTSKDSQVSQGD